MYFFLEITNTNPVANSKYQKEVRMSNSKKNNRFKNTTNNQSKQSTAANSKDLVDSTSKNASRSNVIPDEVERRDGPGGD